MATPISSNFTRLTSADLLKFKHYLVENVSRAMEGEMLQFGDQAETIKQRLNEAYVQTKVSLPEDIRTQIFNEILDEMTGFGPIQPLLDDPDMQPPPVLLRHGSGESLDGCLYCFAPMVSRPPDGRPSRIAHVPTLVSRPGSCDATGAHSAPALEQR